MSTSPHDALCKAFEDAGATVCFATKARRYSHIHAPNKPKKADAKRCTNHCVVVEEFNGTIRIQDSPIDLAACVGGTSPATEGSVQLSFAF